MKQLLILLFVTGALIATACTSTSTTCDSPDIKCGNLCVDPRLDPNNCGGCDQVCSAGFVCATEQGKSPACTCPAGSFCTLDLFAACFHAGTVVPVERTTLSPTVPSTDMLNGPQSLAATEDGHTLLALDSLDDTLFTIDRTTMKVLGSVLVQSTGTSFPSQVLVRGDRAYVVKSGTNSVAVVDFSDLTKPKVVGEVSTGAGTGPEGAAFDGAGNLWVSLLQTGQLVEIAFSGDNGTAQQPIDLPDLVGAGSQKFPTGVAVFGDKVYVTMNHLDASFKPLIPGNAAVVPTSGGTPTLIDLGNDCLNAGFVASRNQTLWIACTGSYNNDGAVVALDTTTNKVVKHIATGGAPARLSVVSGHVYAADASGPNLIDVDTDNGTFRSNKVCLVSDGDPNKEFVGDVLAL